MDHGVEPVFLARACRFLIQILPAAVVAPLYFQGKIEFGVINQSSSAFNHILSDVSLVVYQVCFVVHAHNQSTHACCSL